MRRCAWKGNCKRFAVPRIGKEYHSYNFKEEQTVRYRDVNSLADFSREAAAAIDFIGQAEYRSSLEMIGRSLRAKGFVTPFDDAMFSLELDLWNLENLRVCSSGLISSLPSQCH